MRLAVLTSTLLLAFFCAPVYSQHVVGGGLGLGLQDFESRDGEELGLSDGINTELFYRYMLNDNIGIEASVYAGTGGVLSSLSGMLFDVRDMRYTGVRGGVYGQTYLSDKNKLFARVGVSQSELKYRVDKIWSQDDPLHVSSHGSDIFAAIGWGMDFKSGFGVTAEYQYVPVQELTVHNVSLGFSYRF